jgi:predicted nucleotidyltransferase
MLNRDTIITYLEQHKAEFVDKYSINKIGLFGSFATEKNVDSSDIDIVYETSSKGLTFKEMMNLENELNLEFGKNIDLVNYKYMNPLIKRKAIKDIIYV